MTCARRAGYPMCETCTAAGLIRCPSLGAPLPLVEGERPRVERRPKLVWLPGGMSHEEAERLLDKFYGPRR